MDGGAWWAAVHGVARSQTQKLSVFTFAFHFHALEKEMATHSSVLAWRIQGWQSLVGCHLWGCTESDTTEATAAAAAAAADCSPPGSSVHGIFQARVLEWGAVAFSIFSMLLLLLSRFSCVRLCATP